MYKVLLVDDEYMILQGLTMIIDWQALGFEVVQTARSGKEALAYLTQYPVDVMISDVTMPGMTGLDLIEAANLSSSATNLDFIWLSRILLCAKGYGIRNQGVFAKTC